MFNLDLKRAETALQAGRLDDVYRILRSSSDARHANGQKLIDRLVDAFLVRSQQHFDQEYFQQARRDAQRAEELGGHQLEVARLIEQVNAKDVSIAGRASQQAAEALVSEFAKLVSAGKHEAAIAKYRDVRHRVLLSPEIKSFVSEAAENLTEQAGFDFVSGRIDRCESTLRTLAAAGFAGPIQRELKDQVERCYNVNRATDRSDYGKAIRELRLLAQVVPEAAWVNAMVKSLQVCLDNVEQIKSGPFGLLKRPAGVSVKHPKNAGDLDWNRKSQIVNEPIHKNRFQKDTPLSAVTSVLQVDRLGSLMLIQGDVCSVGGATTSRCDVAIQTEGVQDRIQICRDGEDYFAVSKTPFFVNDLLADRHLLVDGDTVHVGVRGRLKFCKPIPASSSAVLQITGSKLKRRDIRSIVLIDDAVVFGKRMGHFRLSDFEPPLILRSNANSKGEFLLHQKGSDQQQLLCDGTSVLMNDCHFALVSTQSIRGVS